MRPENGKLIKVSF